MVGQEHGVATRRIGRRHFGLDVGQCIGVAEADAAQDRTGQPELEGHVQRAFLDVARCRGRRIPDLADEERVRLDRLDPRSEALEPGEGLGPVLQLRPVLDQVLGGIQPEPINAQVVQPERRHVVHRRGDRRVCKVQVRHPLPEVAVVPAIAVLVPDRGAAGAGDPRIRVRPDVPVVVRRAGRPGVLEPGVLDGAVVQDQVHHHVDTSLVRSRHQGAEVVGGAIVGLDGLVVRDVVAVIAGRLGDGHQPQGRHAEIVRGRRITVVQVVQPLRQTAQVADAVAIRIGEAAHEHLVEDAITPPRRLGGWGRRGCGCRVAGDRLAGRRRRLRAGRCARTARRDGRDRGRAARRGDHADDGRDDRGTTPGRADGMDHGGEYGTSPR